MRPCSSPHCFSFAQSRVSLQHTEFPFKCHVVCGCCIISGFLRMTVCVCLHTGGHRSTVLRRLTELIVRGVLSICCIINHWSKHDGLNKGSRFFVFTHKNSDINVCILLTQHSKNIARFDLALMSLASGCTLRPDILRMCQVNFIQII